MKFMPCPRCADVLVGDDERACRPCLERGLTAKFHTVALEQQAEMAEVLGSLVEVLWPGSSSRGKA